MKTKAPVAALILLLAGGIAIFAWLHPSPELYRTFQSPDGEYRVVVYRIPARLAVMPGQGSDVPGILRLYSKSGRLLRERKLAMVSLADDVEWSPGQVNIRPVVVWTLPKSGAGSP